MVGSVNGDSEGDGKLKILALLGLKHSGKSSIAKLLGERFSWPWQDLDALVFLKAAADFGELAAQDNPAQGVRSLYRLKGKETFQRYEREAGLDFIKLSPADTPVILSLGGGSMENRELMEPLKARTTLVFLDAPADVLYPRVIKNGIPPFLDENNPRESFLELYGARRSLAQAYAHKSFDLGTKDLQEAFETISTFVEELRNGWK